VTAKSLPWKGRPKAQSVLNQYTHRPLGQEVRSISGSYAIEEEKSVSFRGREVLLAKGWWAVDNSCCGTGGCGFALVPGYVLAWKSFRNERGEAVTEIEPVKDEQEKQALREFIQKVEKVQQVNFW
jgi:hypothetical protein